MRYYPLLLQLTFMRCLVVGAGEVGQRKTEGLLPCEPEQVLLVDPATPTPDIQALLASYPNFGYAQRSFAMSDLDGMHLVFACTSHRDTNAHISQACARRGILCSVADAPEQGNFVLPASIVQGDLILSVSTNGASPALSRVIRQELQERYGSEYAEFTCLLRKIRVALLALGMPSAENRIIFRNLATSSLPQIIRAHDRDQCQALLSAMLPVTLHPRIGEWCDDCFQTV
ncbi:MAG: bifunctional precorrin-2 dehydrogenase/sirohydrochlorin ferrochelatase [Desulfovibrionales bacterium]|nr:bifunctional precorrin-2 dehydrogenase/sirohydrochlorin ferrochelatase [Desulfovibrionales bacterium]